MSEPSLFENEQQVITETEAFLAKSNQPAEATLTRFHKLLKSYKKFLRHFSRVVKINDRQQTQLRKQEVELRAEIEKRKEIEFKLRENEKQLVHARDLAEQALEDRARFFASMSHEIRTPLNGVIGSANLLQTSKVTREQKEFISTIIASSKILLVVINDILDFSKIESGKLELESLPIHLESLIEEVFDITAISAFSKGVEVLFACNIPNHHQINFLGDLTRISQVLINLLNNAIKFTHKGIIILRITSVQDSLGNPFLQFSLQDTGIGISIEQQKQLFKAFSQAESSTTREYGGTGLGLSICHHLTHLWGGNIWAESLEGEGSTFSFTLPYHEIDEKREEVYYPELEEKHLLILDPNQQVLHQIQRVLDLQMINYSLASNIEDAIEAIQSQPAFDLFIINHSFEDQTAKQALQQLNLASQVKIPNLILVPPGLELEEDPTGDMPTATLSKPYKRQQLFTTIYSILEGYSLDQRSPMQAPPNLYRRFPMNILIAEDNQINQAIATATFKQLGYQTTMAANGKEALEKAASSTFDLIFMDVQMPIMDGFEASKELLLRYKSACPPIVAITANASSSDRQDCLNAGMSDFLSKPLLIEDLTQMIIKWGEKLGIQGSEEIEEVLLDNPSNQAEQSTAINFDPIPQMFNKAMFHTLKTNYSNDLLKEITTHYVEELDNSLNLVEEQLKNKDWQQLKKTSHKIRGSSLNLGVESIANLYSVIEEAATDEDQLTIQKATKQIRELHRPVCEGIQQLTNES